MKKPKDEPEDELRAEYRLSDFKWPGVRGKYAEAARKYFVLQKQVMEILARHDPIGLIEAGSPADEYSMEASTILATLGEVSGSDGVLRRIREVFMDYFGPTTAASECAYAKAADEIWDAWESYHGRRCDQQ